MEDLRMSFSNEELEEIMQMHYLPLKCETFSKRLNKIDDSKRKRNEYQRDYTRIMYSSSFRRLQGKMQLLVLENDKFYRNRLTHSLEVSQIARSIAEDIGHDIQIIKPNDIVYRDDTYVVEACSLAHDIGNPPFGHKGERVLHSLCKDDYGFEGNAQTLRVLMNLEKKYADCGGLNLTLRTILGVTKYYKKYQFEDSTLCKNKSLKKVDKFIYSDTYDILNKIVNEENIKLRTLDVQIVDLSDEIAYAAHDLEDALSLNLFTTDELLYEFKLNEGKYKDAYPILELLIKQSKNEADKAKRMNSSEEYSYLFRKELTSNIVHTLIKDIGLIEVNDENRNKTGSIQQNELGFKTLEGLAKGLKHITFDCINRRDHVQIYESQGEKVIKGLFDVFIDNPNKYLPVEFRTNDNSEINKKRLVIDYIAGMMDSFAIESYIKFYGKESFESLYGICIKK